MQPTRVIHVKDAPRGWETDPSYVYIGRPGKGHTGYYGNPFRLKPGQPRGDALKAYEVYLGDVLAKDKIFARNFRLLAGKTLVCFCVPRPWTWGDGGVPVCHGQIMAKVLHQPA